MTNNKSLRLYVISNDPQTCGACIRDGQELSQADILNLQLDFVLEDYLSRHGAEPNLSVSLSIDEDDNCHACCTRIKNELFIDISAGFLKKIFYTSTLSTLSYYIYCALIDDINHYSNQEEGLAELAKTLDYLRISIYSENTENLCNVKIADLAKQLHQKYWFALEKIGYYYESAIRFILAHELSHLLQPPSEDNFESEIEADTQALLCSANFNKLTKESTPTDLLELTSTDDYKSALFLMTHFEIVDARDSTRNNNYYQAPCKTHSAHPGGMHRFIHLSETMKSETKEARELINSINRLILGWRNCAIIACAYPRESIANLTSNFINSEKQNLKAQEKKPTPQES